MSETRAGFEWRNTFYAWSFTNIAKDLMLLDRITGMPASDFVELWNDVEEGQRTPVLLALIATSLRAGHPEWSVDRVYRTVMNIDLVDDIAYITPEEADDSGPPAGAAQPPTSERGRSQNNGSSQPSTPQEPSTYETSFGTPV